ncbi:MAG: histidine kinase [Prevotella sp.]|nr:histidine kinase [Prevotella sp.]
MTFEKNRRAETIIYIVLWTMLFMAPVMSMSVRSTQTGIDFDWSEIFTVWKQYAVYFLVFLIHNHLMAPMLIYHQQKWRYLGLSVAIIVIFQVYQCNHRPNFRDRGPRHEMIEKFDQQRPPMPPEFESGDFEPGEFKPDEPKHDFEPGEPKHDLKPLRHEGPRRQGEKHPPLILGQRDIIALIIVVLMLGMNLGIKLYFKQRNDQKHVDELERQNLEQQLEYLKYQINPHFFMNTLNNIHALVDIDPEKAKSTILELSKMMRFVLYEGSKTVVPLEREISFLQNYITLMKLRYTDKVRIDVDVAQALPNKDVPPLMFITFVENAFKHGVSYRQESFIEIKIEEVKREGASLLAFTCRNSRIPKEEDKHGGVGLANVRQRLDLIYGKNYQLDIQDESDIYQVKLAIPL